MQKSEIKEIIMIIFLGLINIIISFSITNALGLSNIIVIRTYSALVGNMTWECIIFLLLYLFEGVLSEIYQCNKEGNLDNI